MLPLAACGLAWPSLLACGGSDERDELDDPDLVATGRNPAGVPYPIDRLGGVARQGAVPGQRIPNLVLRGYEGGDRSRGFVPLELARYYDPEAKSHALLHIQIAATWCAICASEAQATAKVRTTYEARGVRFLAIVVNGNEVRFGPSQSELDGWVATHAVAHDIAVDVRARRVAGLGVTQVPWNMLVDPRSMELLHSMAGAPDDLVAYLELGLDFVTKYAPSY